MNITKSTNLTNKIDYIVADILADNKYDKKLKNELISTKNRIKTLKTRVNQLYRNAYYIQLYNLLNEEIIYLSNQQTYFSEFLDTKHKQNVFNMIEIYIKLSNIHLNKL